MSKREIIPRETYKVSSCPWGSLTGDSTYATGRNGIRYKIWLLHRGLGKYDVHVFDGFSGCEIYDAEDFELTKEDFDSAIDVSQEYDTDE